MSFYFGSLAITWTDSLRTFVLRQHVVYTAAMTKMIGMAARITYIGVQSLS